MWDIFMGAAADNSADANADNNDSLTEDEMVDEFITFFSDGVYTTGHFMMMLSYNLAKHPEWKHKLRE